MGTAHLILAAAARKRQLESQRRMRESERRRRESADRRRKALEENSKNGSKSKKTSSSYYSYDTKRSYSFEEHLILLINNNPEFLDYVKSLFAEGESLDISDRRKIATELDEVAPQILEEERKLAEIRKKIEESGIVIGSQYIIEGVRIDQKGPLPLSHNVGTHRYTFNNYPIQFNGIRVNKEDLENDGAYYEAAYAKERNENPNVEEQLEKDKRKLERQRRILNLPFMDTESRERLIKDLETAVARGEFAIRRINDRRKELDTFKGFTPEQKKLIAEYIEQVYKVKELADPAGARVKQFEEIGLPYKSTDKKRAKWERANDSLIQSGKVSKETVDRFYTMLAGELDRVYTAYDEGIPFSEVPHSALGSEGPLSWIIRTKGIEFVREKRDKLLEEQKKLDETIALTEKRDDMLEQKEGDSGKEEEGRG